MGTNRIAHIFVNRIFIGLLSRSSFLYDYERRRGRKLVIGRGVLYRALTVLMFSFYSCLLKRSISTSGAFDGTSTESAPLDHLTASRPKNPKKRPPSSVFLKEMAVVSNFNCFFYLIIYFLLFRFSKPTCRIWLRLKLLQ